MPRITIGDRLDVTLSGRAYTITRRDKYRYEAVDQSLGVRLGDFNTYAKAYDAIVRAADEANMIPSTTRAIANVHHLSMNGNTPAARKFWTLRLNRMRPVS